MCVPENCVDVLKSLQQIQQKKIDDEAQLEQILRASRLMVNAAEIYRRMTYPIKQGNCIIRLLDQAILELRSFSTDEVTFHHKRFLNEVFIRDDQYTSPLLLDDIESSDSLEGEPVIRVWKVRQCIKLLLKCKRNLLIEQLSFLVERIKMTAFIGEVRANRYLAVANKGIIVSLTNGLETVVENDRLRVPLEKSRVEVVRRLFGDRTVRLRQQDVSAEIKQSPSIGYIGSSKSNNKANRQRIFCDYNYNLLWDNTNKEYYKVLLTDIKDVTSSQHYTFLGRLNTKIKFIRQCKEDTSLGQSFLENGMAVGMLIVLAVIITLLSIFAEGAFTQVSCFSLCLGCIGAILFKVLTQERYSNESFRCSIKGELTHYFETTKSDYIYEMQPIGYDIRVINKDVN